MKKTFENTRGVTLIALIITIIVLLILAGVAFNTLLGSNGLLNRASAAAEKSRQAANNEEIALQELDNEIAYWSNRGSDAIDPNSIGALASNGTLQPGQYITYDGIY